MKNTERFTERVKNYVLYRPHYPEEIIPFLSEKTGLKKEWIIADIGSGTGISAELFVNNGNRVYGIEPNENMRQSAEAKFKGNTHFTSINATAEATSLPANSVDMVVVAQACHWFDKSMSKIEFQRILKPGGYLVLMWNDRNMSSEFQQAYERMLEDFALEYDKVNHRKVEEGLVESLFAPHPHAFHAFQHSQFFDFESLKGRLLSSSYAPLEPHPNYPLIIQRLREIFDRYSVNSKVEFDYNCNLYFGRIK